MAHLWTSSDSGDWTPTPLDADAEARFPLRRLIGPPDGWALISGDPTVRVNGSPLPLGIALLDDRDEISLPDRTVWFSTETQPQVEPFPESDARGFCPRCKLPIESASPSVRCPACGLWHHASDTLPCWTYAPTCTACAQETALDAGFRWTPEDL